MLRIQMENAKATLKDTISTACYASDTTIGGRTTINGLQTVITQATGTYAGINRATAGNEYWRSNVNATTHTLANVQDPTSTSYLPSIMRTSLMNATHDQSPDFIVTTKTNYALYMNIAAAQLLRIDEGVATFGFGGAQFGAGVTMAFDTYITAGLYTTSYDPMFFLTLTDWDVFAFEGANFDMEPEGWRKPTDQDAKVGHILVSGQLRCFAPRQQAVIQNIATS